MHQTKARPRAIIVEDEVLVLMLLEDMLKEEGIDVAGTAGDLEAAIALVRTATFDFAILDAHIVGGDVKPVFDILHERSIAVIFSTGASPAAIRDKFGEVPVLAKPYLMDDLKSAVQQISVGRNA